MKTCFVLSSFFLRLRVMFFSRLLMISRCHFLINFFSFSRIAAIDASDSHVAYSNLKSEGSAFRSMPVFTAGYVIVSIPHR